MIISQATTTLTPADSFTSWSFGSTELYRGREQFTGHVIPLFEEWLRSLPSCSPLGAAVRENSHGGENF